MVERLRMNAIKKKDYEWKFISPDSRTNGAQPEDQYEKEVLAKFLKHKPSPPTGVEKSKPSQAVGGEQDVEWDEHPSPPAGRYLYYQAVRAEKKCTTFCHHDTAVLPGSEPAIPSLFGRARPDGGNWAEGDLMAVLRVEFSNELVQKEVKWYWNTLLGVAIITGFLALVAFYSSIRYRDHPALAAPAAGERRDQPRQHRPAGRDPHRRRVRDPWPWPSTACCGTWSPSRTNSARSTPTWTARSTSWPRSTCSSTR